MGVNGKVWLGLMETGNAFILPAMMGRATIYCRKSSLSKCAVPIVRVRVRTYVV